MTRTLRATINHGNHGAGVNLTFVVQLDQAHQLLIHPAACRNTVQATHDHLEAAVEAGLLQKLLDLLNAAVVTAAQLESSH